MKTLEDVDKEAKENPPADKRSQQAAALGEIESKIDQMLEHQKTVRRIAIFRGIISFIFFLVFIVLPIVGGFYLFQHIKASGILEQVSGQYQDFYQALGSLKETAGQAESLGDMLNGVAK